MDPDGVTVAGQSGAEMSWPDAAVAISGIALVGVVVVVVVWQALATWRTRIAIAREEAYRQLTEQIAHDLRSLREHLGVHDDPDDPDDGAA